MKKLIFFIALSVTACSTSPSVEKAERSINEQDMLSHITELSSDSYMGRGTGTEGERMSADYLVEQFRSMGATSGVEDGSFLQPFPLVGQKTSDHEMRFLVNGRERIKLTFFEDFVAWPADESTEIDINGAELVYVGYGIQAPEEDWDDLKGMDVSGKILVIKNNDPEYDDDLFGGKTRLYYGRYTYKYEKAEELGALGAIIIHSTETAGYGWNVVSNSWSRERFNVKSASGDQNATKLNAWITYDKAQALFGLAGLDLDAQMKAADSPGFKPVSLGRVRMNTSLQATYRDINALNVLATIEGNDPELKDEFLVLTAHYDHLGITSPVEGDSINNGAEDNAAGVSAVLEMMEAYKVMQPRLKRSVLALIVSAEEVGLLGSQYWAENPTVDPAKVSANINMDGMNVYGETSDVVVVGYGRTTLSDLVVDVAGTEGRAVKPDARPAQGIFYRSDHFNMAKVGIPAIFPNPGTEFVDKPEGFKAIADSVKAANYHSVSDEVNEYWDLSGAEKDTRLFFKVGLEVLQAPELQSWKKGDEFEAARLRSLDRE